MSVNFTTNQANYLQKTRLPNPTKYDGLAEENKKLKQEIEKLKLLLQNDWTLIPDQPTSSHCTPPPLTLPNRVALSVIPSDCLAIPYAKRFFIYPMNQKIDSAFIQILIDASYSMVKSSQNSRCEIIPKRYSNREDYKKKCYLRRKNQTDQAVLQLIPKIAAFFKTHQIKASLSINTFNSRVQKTPLYASQDITQDLTCNTLKKALTSYEPKGGTDLRMALDFGFDQTLKSKKKFQALIFFTDAETDDTGKIPRPYSKTIHEHIKNQKVNFSAIGIGSGCDQDFLEGLCKDKKTTYGTYIHAENLPTDSSSVVRKLTKKLTAVATHISLSSPNPLSSYTVQVNNTPCKKLNDTYVSSELMTKPFTVDIALSNKPETVKTNIKPFTLQYEDCIGIIRKKTLEFV